MVADFALIVMSEFTLSTALSISTSSEDFPVNFDAAWRWIGYRAKRSAKDVLINRFEDGLDYTITDNCSVDLCKTFRNKHEPLFAKFVLTHPPNKREQKVGTEQTIQQRLLNYFGSIAAKEVCVRTGRIDILTPDYLIEIKSGGGWRAGLGQLLAYATAYPDHEKILYLFDVSYRVLSVTVATCKLENVEVWLHSDWEKKLPAYVPQVKEKDLVDREVILLTLDCFKTLALISETEEGKHIRRCFAECTRQLKKTSHQDDCNFAEELAKGQLERERQEIYEFMGRYKR